MRSDDQALTVLNTTYGDWKNLVFAQKDKKQRKESVFTNSFVSAIAFM